MKISHDMLIFHGIFSAIVHINGYLYCLWVAN